jgi:hypothetical protein
MNVWKADFHNRFSGFLFARAIFVRWKAILKSSWAIFAGPALGPVSAPPI